MFVLTSLLVLGVSTFVLGATSGCGVDHSNEAGQNSSRYHIRSSGGLRSFLVHVPSNYKSQRPTGLIISYHGAGKDAANQEALSQFSKEDYNPNWLAVYPHGINGSWEGPDYTDPSVHDTEFTEDLLTYMRRNYCVDDTRIYASGKSNGGGFVGTLACHTVGSNFAAFAPVSGAFYTDANSSSLCNKARSPLPIMEFHGQNDTRIPYFPTHAGHGGPLPAIPDWLQRWAVRDGCTAPPANYSRAPSVYDDKVIKTTFSCGDYVDIVTGYYIAGLRHAWPSKSPNSDNPQHPTVIEATQVIMKFFEKYRLINGETVVVEPALGDNSFRMQSQVPVL